MKQKIDFTRLKSAKSSTLYAPKTTSVVMVPQMRIKTAEVVLAPAKLWSTCVARLRCGSPRLEALAIETLHSFSKYAIQ